jgi:hypothetical protein
MDVCAGLKLLANPKTKKRPRQIITAEPFLALFGRSGMAWPLEVTDLHSSILFTSRSTDTTSHSFIGY